MFEALRAVADAVGEDRTGIRVSPFSPFSGMGEEPYSNWDYLFLRLKREFPRLSHVSTTEPRDNYLRRGDAANVNESKKCKSRSSL
jgi:NADPH2 dehydrogenase